MLKYNELIKKLISLDVIWGSRSKKASGIQDRNNILIEDVIFIAPDTIVTTSALPNWMDFNCSGKKAIRIMNDSTHPNSNKKYYIIGKLGLNSVQVVGETSADTVVSCTKLTQISGRIWEVVNNKNICWKDIENNTIFNTHHQEKGNKDGGDISLVHFDHYHGKIITHENNSAGNRITTYDEASGQHILGGPQIAVDNDGEVIIS